MTPRGRKPTPPALRAIEGDRGKRKRAANPEPPAESPSKPQWSSLFPGAKAADLRRWAEEEWRRVVPELEKLKLLAKIDRAVLVDYCLCWARLVQCERALATEGLVREVHTLDAHGHDVLVQLVRNPLSTTANEYRKQLARYVSELGLSPSSRGRIALPEKTGGAGEGAGRLLSAAT